MDKVLDFLVSEVPRLTVLVVASAWPARMNACAGVCIYVGNWSPSIAPYAQQFTFFGARDHRRAVEVISILRPNGFAKADIVVIDHDHSILKVAEQYNAALAAAHDDTIFVFDDAVPQNLEMTREPPPASGWWVGQVWMLAALLVPIDHKGFSVSAKIGPTGVIVATRCGPIDIGKIENLRATADAGGIDEILGVLACQEEAKVFEKLAIVAKRLKDLKRREIHAADDGDGIVRRTILDKEHQRVQMPADFVLDLSSRNLDLTPLYRKADLTPGKYLDTFVDLHIVKHTNMIRGNQFFRLNARHADRDLLRIAKSSPESYDYSRIYEDHGHFYVDLDVLAGAEQLPKDLFLATPDEPDNWGMWMLYAIPSIMYYLNHKRDYSGLLICCHHAWQRSLLFYMGVPNEVILEHVVDKSYFCPEITTIRRSFRNLSLSQSDIEVYSAMVAKERRPSERPPKSRIFISRRTRSAAPNAYRILQNENELADALEREGFDVVEPEAHSFGEQIALFNSADVVVGLGGAGMFNTVFCRPGTKVVTIESGMGFIGSHANIFATMNLPHGLIIGREDETDTRRDHRRWTINVPEAVRAISAFI